MLESSHNKSGRFAWIVYVIIVPSLLGLTGFKYLYSSARTYLKSRQLIDWPVTEGVILSSEFLTRFDESIRKPKVIPKVKYSYVVNGIMYNGSFITTNDELLSSDLIKYFISYHFPGKSVAVSYLPTNPAYSVLERGFFYSAFYVPLTGVLFVLSSIMMFIFSKNKFGNPSQVVDNNIAITRVFRLLSFIVIRVLPAVILLYGLGTISLRMIHLRRMVNTSRWERVTGKILLSDFETIRTGYGRQYFVPHILYKFDVKSTDNHNNNPTERYGFMISYGSQPTYYYSKIDVQNILKKYIKGQLVDVFYLELSTDRVHSVLEPGLNADFLLSFLVPTMCIVIGTVVMRTPHRILASRKDD